jgi:hypothetical protein
MLSLRNRRGDVNPWVPFVILLIVFGLFVVFMFLPTRNRANKIHGFLGTNQGPKESWSGLVGSYESNNEFHREQYTKIACELWKLKNPGRPEPDPCPPGPPTTKPPGGPDYP